MKSIDSCARAAEGAASEARDRVAELLGPEPPESLQALLASLPPRARYIGPEAWLEALRRESEAKGVDSKAH